MYCGRNFYMLWVAIRWGQFVAITKRRRSYHKLEPFRHLVTQWVHRHHSTPIRSGYKITYIGYQTIPKRIKTFKNIESHHEFHHDNSGRFTTFLAVMDLYINMMMSTMPGSHGRPLWRKQLQSAWDHPDWLQLKQKGLVLKMSTDPPNSSKIRCEMEEVSAARIIFHILCSTICLSKKCGFAPVLNTYPVTFPSRIGWPSAGAISLPWKLIQ